MGTLKADDDPLEAPATVVAAERLTEDGTVYGQAPKAPADPPDLELLFEYADIPGPKEGGLPHSLEWYAGAKDRAKQREEEKEALSVRKYELKQEWADLVKSNLQTWLARTGLFTDRSSGKDDEVTQSVNALAELVARTHSECPQDKARIAMLEAQLEEADSNFDRLHGELLAVQGELRQCEERIEAQGVLDAKEEEARLEAKKLEEARRAKAEYELKRQEALLRGEEMPQFEGAADADPSATPGVPELPAAHAAAGAPPHGGGAPAAPPAVPLPLSAPIVVAAPFSPSWSPLPPPPAAGAAGGAAASLRGGLQRELPPLNHEASPSAAAVAALGLQRELPRLQEPPRRASLPFQP